MVDIQAVQPPGGPAHQVRGLLGEKVFRRIRPGPGVLLVAKPLPLLMDAITGDSHGPGHDPEDQQPGRSYQHDRRHAPHPGWALSDVQDNARHEGRAAGARCRYMLWCPAA